MKKIPKPKPAPAEEEKSGKVSSRGIRERSRISISSQRGRITSKAQQTLKMVESDENAQNRNVDKDALVDDEYNLTQNIEIKNLAESTQGVFLTAENIDNQVAIEDTGYESRDHAETIRVNVNVTEEEISVGGGAHQGKLECVTESPRSENTKGVHAFPDTPGSESSSLESPRSDFYLLDSPRSFYTEEGDLHSLLESESTSPVLHHTPYPPSILISSEQLQKQNEDKSNRKQRTLVPTQKGYPRR